MPQTTTPSTQAQSHTRLRAAAPCPARSRRWHSTALAGGLAALMGLAGSAWGAPPTTASIETLLAVTKSEALLTKTSADLERNMQTAVRASLQGRAPTAHEQQAIDQMSRESAALLRQELGWSTIRPLLVQIYQNTFTQEEVDGQIAFYRTPVGEAVVDKMPAVMQASMAVTQQRLARLMPQLQASMKKAMAQTHPDHPDDKH